MRADAVVSVLLDIIAEQTERERYRAYLYENIRLLCENSAGLVSGGKYIPVSYQEIAHPKPVDNRSAEEIIADIIKNAGLEVIG